MNDAESAQRHAFVQEAVLHLDPGINPASVGAAVTVELCGHWQHEGPCRWPHNNDIHPEPEPSPARFRTLFVSNVDEEAEVRERITRALSQAAGVSVAEVFPRPVAAPEEALAECLLRSAGGTPQE